MSETKGGNRGERVETHVVLDYVNPEGTKKYKKVKVVVPKNPPPPPNFIPEDESELSWQPPKVGVDRSQPTGDQD